MDYWYKLLPKWAWTNIKALVLAPYLATQYHEVYGNCDNATCYEKEPRLLSKHWRYATWDNSLLGDCAWKTMQPNHWAWRAKLGWCPKVQAYLGRLGWLWRNPAHGYERTMLAAILYTYDVTIVQGDPWIQDGDNGRAGVCRVQHGRYWSYNKIKKLWFGRCLKIVTGWELKTYAEVPSRVGTEPVAKYVMTIRFPKFKEA